MRGIALWLEDGGAWEQWGTPRVEGWWEVAQGYARIRVRGFEPARKALFHPGYHGARVVLPVVRGTPGVVAWRHEALPPLVHDGWETVFLVWQGEVDKEGYPILVEEGGVDG